MPNETANERIKQTEDKPLGLTKSDLLELLTEVRKPVKTEEEIRAEKEKQADRAILADTLRLKEANKKAAQEACSHMRRDGSTTAVYVTNLQGMYCQACQLMIYPNEKPDIFNRLFQLAQ